jgi:Protein of unknown function (DUF3309)
MLNTILLLVVILLLIAVIPAWPYSRAWGYIPTVIMSVLLIVLLLWILELIPFLMVGATSSKDKTAPVVPISRANSPLEEGEKDSSI